MTLDLSYTKMTHKGLTSLAKMPCLKELHVWGGWKYLPQYYEYKFFNRTSNLTKEQNHRCEFDVNRLTEMKEKFSLTHWSISLREIDSNFILSNIDKEEVQTLQISGGCPPKPFLDFLLKCDTLRSLYI